MLTNRAVDWRKRLISPQLGCSRARQTTRTSRGGRRQLTQPPHARIDGGQRSRWSPARLGVRAAVIAGASPRRAREVPIRCCCADQDGRASMLLAGDAAYGVRNLEEVIARAARRRDGVRQADPPPAPPETCIPTGWSVTALEGRVIPCSTSRSRSTARSPASRSTRARPLPTCCARTWASPAPTSDANTVPVARAPSSSTARRAARV